MEDQRTALLGLPLPHPGNDLADDVLRLRAAFVSIDHALGPSHSVAITRDESGRITAITSTRPIGDIETTLTRDSISGAVTAVASVDGTARTTHTFTRNGAGAITSVTRTEDTV